MTLAERMSSWVFVGQPNAGTPSGTIAEVEADAPVDVDNDRASIERIHGEWIRANKTWSLDHFDPDRFVTPDVVCFVGNGSVFRGRDAIIAEWQTLAMAIEDDWDLDVFDRSIRIVGDAAWVTYEFHLTGVFDAEPFNERGRGTEIYERRDGEWLMAVGHWSWRQQ